MHFGVKNGPKCGGSAEQDESNVSRGQLRILPRESKVGGRDACARGARHDAEEVQLEALLCDMLRVAAQAVI